MGRSSAGPTVGVLALQGSASRHVEVLEGRGLAVRLVRQPADVLGLDALVLPGGESTTMLKLLDRFAMRAPLEAAIRDLVERGRPVFATCAGLILLAKRVTDPEQTSLGLLDVDAARNAYGRQLASGVFDLEGENGFPAAQGDFIRAPRITRVGANVVVLSRRDGDPVAVEEGSLIAATFHPEADADHPLVRRFVSAVRRSRRGTPDRRPAVSRRSP